VFTSMLQNTWKFVPCENLISFTFRLAFTGFSCSIYFAEAEVYSNFPLNSIWSHSQNEWSQAFPGFWFCPPCIHVHYGQCKPKNKQTAGISLGMRLPYPPFSFFEVWMHLGSRESCVGCSTMHGWKHKHGTLDARLHKWQMIRVTPLI